MQQTKAEAEEIKWEKVVYDQVQNSQPQDDDEEDMADARCEFCHYMDPEFANEDNDALDLHYIHKCLMLTTCKGCSKIVEISKYANHLVTECEERDFFKQCIRCQAVLPAGD